MSNHYTAKVAESLKLRGWIDEIQAKSLRNELDRHKSCLEVARVSLSKVISGFDAKEIDEFRVSHEGCAGGEIFMDEVIECYDTIHQINEVLGGDSTKTTEK